MGTAEKIYYIIYAVVIVIGLVMAIYNLYLTHKLNRELDKWAKETHESYKKKDKED